MRQVPTYTDTIKRALDSRITDLESTLRQYINGDPVWNTVTLLERVDGYIDRLRYYVDELNILLEEKARLGNG